MGEISRRRFLGFAAGAAGALLLPQRTIFLPPNGGWPRAPLASLIIPRSDASMWDTEIAAGKATYDPHTETMSWWAEPEAHEPAAWVKEFEIAPEARADTYDGRIFKAEGVQRLVYRGATQAWSVKLTQPGHYSSLNCYD